MLAFTEAPRHTTKVLDPLVPSSINDCNSETFCIPCFDNLAVRNVVSPPRLGPGGGAHELYDE